MRNLRSAVKKVVKVLLLLVIVLLVAAVVAVNLGLMHSYIEDQARTATGAKVSLGGTTFLPIWPLRLSLGASHIDHESYDVRWQSLSISVTRVLPPFAIVLIADGLRFELKPPPTGKTSTVPPNKQKSETSTTMTPLDLTVQIHDGEIILPQARVSGLEASFAQKVLLQSPAEIHLEAMVEPDLLALKLPLTIESKNLTLTPAKVQTPDLRVGYAGLTLQLSGESNVAEARHHWKVLLSAPDLAKVAQPQVKSPLSHWTGAIEMHLEANKDGATEPWLAQGQVAATKVGAQVDFEHGLLKVHGPLTLSLQTKFAYDHEVPMVETLQASLGLREATVSYQDLLTKASGVDLGLQVIGHGDKDKFAIENLDLAFWNLRAKMSGATKLRSPYNAQFEMSVAPVVLAGLEKLILPLAKSPVQGELALLAHFNGDLMQATKGQLRVDAFKLKNFSAQVDYHKPGGVMMRGPVAGTVEGQAELGNGEFKRIEAHGALELKSLAIVAGPLHKESNKNLSVGFQVRNKGAVVGVERLSVESYMGKLGLSGTIDQATAKTPMKFNIKVDFQPLHLTELRMALPEYRDKIPNGTLSGSIGLHGQMSDKEWFTWPMDLDGQLQAHIPDYTVVESPPPQKAKPGVTGGGTDVNKAASSAFLPSGYLTQHLHMKTAVTIDVVHKTLLVIKGLQVDGQIQEGHFRGGVSLREIFSGGVQMSSLDVPLLDPRPALQGLVKWRDLVIQDAIGFAKPEYKDFATGRMAGSTEFKTYMPGDPSFMQFLKAKGDISMEPVTLNSVKVGQIINDLVQKVPMLKIAPVKVEPLQGTVKTRFDLHDQVMQIEAFNAHDRSGSELQLQGKVALTNMQGDLNGSFLWAQPTVKGCLLEGNADAQGRVIIPVVIKGDLMHSGMGMLGDSASQLGGKALECEKKKLVERVQKEGTKKLEEEVKKGLKGLFGN